MIRVKDPLNDTIALTKKCWTKHILKEHPEMEPFYNELRYTIKEPEYIFTGYIKTSFPVYNLKLSRPLQEGWIPSLRGSAPRASA